MRTHMLIRPSPSPLNLILPSVSLIFVDIVLEGVEGMPESTGLIVNVTWVCESGLSAIFTPSESLSFFGSIGCNTRS